MRKTALTMILLTCGVAMGQNQNAPKSSADISFDKNMASYAMGYRLGLQLAERKDSPFALNIDQTVAGLKAAAAQADLAYDKEQLAQAYSAYQTKLKMFQAEEFKKLADENQSRSDDFLSQNRKKKGIKELASGIQYRVIEEGSGRSPNMNSQVTLHYRGALIGQDNYDNLQEFESTFQRGKPHEIKMSEVGVKGWQEILPMMKVGDKWQVFLPPEMAYGPRGQGPIGPNEVLVFDINLLDVK